MAVNLTLDSIVRKSLGEHHLTLHHYIPFMLNAKRALDDLSLNTLGVVKVAKVTINPTTKIGSLPVDFISEVKVGLEVGDKVREIGHGQTLNTTKDATVFDAVSDYQNTPIDFIQQYDAGTYWGYYGGIFGLGVTWVDEYTIVRSNGTIRINNKSDITEIHLVYLASEEKLNGKSIVHPFAQETILSFMAFKYADQNPKNRFDPQVKEQRFIKERRRLKAMRNKMTPTDVMRSLRREFSQSIKN